jgi:predicted nucleotidyltransferase
MKRLVDLPPVVVQLVREISYECGSIILGGSWAKQEQHIGSDVDLCIVCLDKRRKKHVIRSVEKVVRGFPPSHPFIDARVFTEKEFKELTMGVENPFWFTFLRTAVSLHGEMITIPLLTHIFRDSLWRAITEIQEAEDLLACPEFFDLGCYKLWTAMSLSYTVQCLIYEKQFSKTDQMAFVQQLFGESFERIRSGYLVTRRVDASRIAKGTRGSRPVRTQRANGGSANEKRLESTRECARNLLKYVKSLYRNLD